MANTISNNRISHLINSQVPFFVRNDHRTFVTFLEKYYEYLEQHDKVVNRIKNIQNYRDIDLTENVFAEKLYDAFLKYIPKDALADKTILIKHIKDFYRAKGTEKSVKFLLNILFGKPPNNFYYPKKDILRTSDGKWYIPKSLRIIDVKINGISNTSISGLEKFNGLTLTGSLSDASATVENAEISQDGGVDIYELYLSNVDGEFIDGEEIFSFFADAEATSNIAAYAYSGVLNSVQIINPGSAYKVGDVVIIESIDDGIGAKATVSRTSRGTIKKIKTVYGGAGFQIQNNWVISTGDGYGLNARVAAVSTNNYIHPNSYNIVSTTIDYAANANILNSIAINSDYETFSYPNLAILYVNTSNLTITTSSATNNIKLSRVKSDSNVFFETGDSLNVNNQFILITSSNTKNAHIIANSNLPGSLSSVPFQVIKRANINTTIANSVTYWKYANTGPIEQIVVLTTGLDYSEVPKFDVLSNTIIASMGVLGRMDIVNGGLGYTVGDTIEFINNPDNFGCGALGQVTSINAAGSITGVKFIEMLGHIIGGRGYSQAALPTTNVRSATKTSNANVIVTSILGDGEKLAAANTNIGGIEEIRIDVRGSGYKFSPTINLTQSGDGTAIGKANIITGLFSYPGYYLNDDGMLSSYNFLEDRDYYQNFSYVIRSEIPTYLYKDAVNNLTHPLGMKMFGEYDLIDHSDYESSNIKINDTNNATIFVKYYTKVGNSINIFYDYHGLNIDDEFALEFTTGEISNVSIIERGLGYSNNGQYIAISNTGSGLVGYYFTNSRGSLLSANISNYGSGYNESSNITIVPISQDPTTNLNMTSYTLSNTYVPGFDIFSNTILMKLSDSSDNSNVYFDSTNTLKLYTPTGDSYNVVIESFASQYENVSNLTANVNFVISSSNLTINTGVTILNTSNLLIRTGKGSLVNIATLHTLNTSNLTVSTGTGTAVNVVNLSAWAGNSNIKLSNGDLILVNGISSNVVNVRANSNIIYVSPGITGSLSSSTLKLYKSAWAANSNVQINIGDSIEVNGNNTFIAHSQPFSNILKILPGLQGNLLGKVLNIYQTVARTNAVIGRSNVTIEANDTLNVNNNLVVVISVDPTSNIVLTNPDLPKGLNTSFSVTKSWSYINLVSEVLTMNTSNLKFNTTIGNTVSVLQLSGQAGNSNVAFDTGYQLYVNGAIVTVMTYNAQSNLISVLPSVSGNLISNTLNVYQIAYKHQWAANSNTYIGNNYTLVINDEYANIVSSTQTSNTINVYPKLSRSYMSWPVKVIKYGNFVSVKAIVDSITGLPSYNLNNSDVSTVNAFAVITKYPASFMTEFKTYADLKYIKNGLYKVSDNTDVNIFSTKIETKIDSITITNPGRNYSSNGYIKFYDVSNIAIKTSQGAFVSAAKLCFPNTSNLTVSTGTGTAVNVVNLSSLAETSNISFSNGDFIIVDGIVANVVNTQPSSSIIYVSPGLSGNLSLSKLQIYQPALYTTSNVKFYTANSIFVAGYLVDITNTSELTDDIYITPGLPGNLLPSLIFAPTVGSDANVQYFTNSDGSIISTTFNSYGFNYRYAPIALANVGNVINASFDVNMGYTTDTSGNVFVTIKTT